MDPNFSNPRLQHNMYDLIGNRLLDALNGGKITMSDLDFIVNNSSFNLGFDVGDDYGIDLGINQMIGPQPVDYKFTLSKRF